MKNQYKILNTQTFSTGNCKIVPIRMEDRFTIMKWRNEQIDILRQKEVLTEEIQDNYFKNVIAKLFNQDKPNQILFSYLKDGKCIGYGGLVHINWIDNNAEISFLLNTELEKKDFIKHWGIYLDLIENIAFKELKLHKLFTYAFDLRPDLYKVLESKDYKKEAILKEHCFFNKNYIDVVIHSKIKKQLNFIAANKNHAKLLFDWANEKTVRNNSLNIEPIEWENHLNWFDKTINNSNNHIFIFFDNKMPIGQIRLDLENGIWLINYSVDKNFRGLGYGTKMIKTILALNSYNHFKAVVKNTNKSSLYIFKKLGFKKKQNDSNIISEFYYNKL